MTDKNMTEQQVLTEELPQAGLLINLFHTLRSFRWEVTTEDMGLICEKNQQVL